MGNTCTGAGSAQQKSDMQMYMAQDHVEKYQRSGKHANVVDRVDERDSAGAEKYAEQQTAITKMHGSGFYSTFNGVPNVPLAVLIEHYQPYEFPICPVINSHTQQLVKKSWEKIIGTEYDCEDTASGKISGGSYFYNHFFSQLFKRLADFSRIFPDIRTRADIFSKVMSFCISIRIEELELVRVKLHHLGLMHKQIIHHAYLFGIYASNMHSTIRHCLGEEATHEVMSAWLHLLSFIMRGMLPSYFEGLPFGGHFSGAVNAVSVVNERVTEEVRNADEMRTLKKKLRNINHGKESSGLQSRFGGGNSNEVTGRDREREKEKGEKDAPGFTLPGAAMSIEGGEMNSTTISIREKSPLGNPQLSVVHEKQMNIKSSTPASGTRSALESPDSPQSIMVRQKGSGSKNIGELRND